MAHTSADTGGSKCAKGLVLLAVLGLRVGWSRRKIAKQDDVYIKDASRTPRLINTRRSRRKVMSEPPTMPLVPRSGISHLPVSMDIDERASPRDADKPPTWIAPVQPTILSEPRPRVRTSCKQPPRK